MRLTLNVTSQDGSYTVTTSLATIVEWERRFKRKASDLANGIGMEDLAFLAYESAKAAGIVVPIVFDDYIKTLIAVDPEPDAVNPTHAAPGDAD